jgi:arylformamidase
VQATITLDGRRFGVDFSRAHDLAIELDFAGPQPRHFGAPRAGTRAFETAGFKGSVARGASCNCDLITLVPHCNGTHTESVGHLTRERFDAWRVVPPGPQPALVVSVTPAADSPDSTEPPAQSGDLLVTRAALEEAWPGQLPFAPQVLVVRTFPNTPEKRARDYSGQVPPYLSREAAQLVVARGIAHLVVDLPSLDRTHDDGRLTAHRIFFGLPRGATQLDEAERRMATITELAFVPESVPDGPCLIELQVPALAGDAVPSRPLWYPVALLS